MECVSHRSRYPDFWDIGSITPEGLERSYHKTPFITMEHKKGFLTENLRAREYPDTKSRFYYFHLMEESEARAVYPKGREVIIFGRTKNKQKIQNSNNYWYLVKPVFYFYVIMSKDEKIINDSSGRSTGKLVWMYGEFIDIKTNFLLSKSSSAAGFLYLQCLYRDQNPGTID